MEHAETFRRLLGTNLDRLSCEERQAVAHCLISKVVVTAEPVDISYALPFEGAPQVVDRPGSTPEGTPGHFYRLRLAHLDAIAQAVDGSIERPLVTFILLARDRDPDAMLAGILPNMPAAVPFIAHDTMGSALGAAWPTPLDGTGLHELVEDHCLVSLSRCEYEGHQLAAPFGPQVDFGTEAAPATA
jgi:hypothetical protein